MGRRLLSILADPAGGVLGLSAVLLSGQLVSPAELSSGKGPLIVFILVIAACLSAIPCYYALRGFSLTSPSSRLRFVAGLCNGLVFLPVGVVASGYASQYLDALRPVVFALAAVLFPAIAGMVVGLVGRRINAGHTS